MNDFNYDTIVNLVVALRIIFKPHPRRATLKRSLASVFPALAYAPADEFAGETCKVRKADFQTLNS